MIADEFPGNNRAAKSLGGTPAIIYLYVDNVDGTVQRAMNHGTTVLRPIMLTKSRDPSNTTRLPRRIDRQPHCANGSLVE
jgi:hypothetical protein